ncbi:MAG: RnfABCDGE type electron transport complex subunit B [Planctomycetes bacterium]|nr:RnfABCDGE type electron transport complex subunit B [Planctomycetota bacterium]
MCPVLPVTVAASAGGYTLFGVLVMLVIGAVLGLVLFAASRFFKTDVDERVEKILDVLPNVNCGACGFGGCAAYAEAVVYKGSACSLCAPGGADVECRIAEIMGASVGDREPLVAVVHCGGGTRSAHSAAGYYGIASCRAASVPGLNSPKACVFGCLGMGDCVAACKFDAMVMGDDGLPLVIESNCVACGACVRACPRNIIQLHPLKSFVHVYCINTDKGRDVRKACDIGCIACMKCEKICPVDAIHVINNVAVIDYDKCISCGKCVKECPQGIIVNMRKTRKEIDRLRQPVPGGTS